MSHSYTFELRLLATVGHDADSAEQALQEICEHFDGHLSVKDLEPTLDSSFAPVLFEIDDQACERREFDLIPDFTGARLRACELLREAARVLDQGLTKIGAPTNHTPTHQAIGEIMSSWKHVRDLNVEPDETALDATIDSVSAALDLVIRTQNILAPIACAGPHEYFGIPLRVELCDLQLQEARDDLKQIGIELESQWQEKQS